MPDDAGIAARLDELRGGDAAGSDGASADSVPIPPEFTDEALALRFAHRHQDRLRYVATWGRWLIRTPAVWHLDETLHAFDLARAVCRAAAAECNERRVAAAIASAKTVAAVERLAKADRLHAATVDQWDADPWLLNTPGGVIDLRTGEARAHLPEDYVTKITAVAPGGECPRWLAFLTRITAGDASLQAFLQRVAGYALTGITREHALFFAYGTGANGKGVFVNTVAGVMGNYSAVAQMETFTATTNDRHPADLAMLRGARLVTAQETEEGRRWAECRIKTLTGGDLITARFMRQDYFTYIPAFKLFIAGNHKPGLRAVDEAIRRRLYLIMFAVKIPVVERDPDLAENLKAEWPGILAWAIEGCLHWQRGGLQPPAAVRDATDQYLESEDAFGQWLAECCDQDRSLWGSVASLFSSWQQWAERGGEFVGSRKRFSQAVSGRGFKSERGTRGEYGFMGVCVKPPSKRSRHPSEDGFYTGDAESANPS